ncbi:LamG-like jellyroll fold domain-containing protein [Planctomycetota bacterium]
MFRNRKAILLALALSLSTAMEVATADFTFGTPVNLGPTVNTPAANSSPSISADGLTLFFDSDRPGGSGDWDVWVTTRETTNDDWGTPVNLGPTVNTSATEGNPGISADGLSLFFDSGRPGGNGGRDIWLTTRDTKDDEWGTPMNLGPTINGPSYDAQSNLSPDGLSFFFSSRRPGGYGDRDTWLTTRETTNDPWREPVNLGQNVNSSSYDSGPSISADGLLLFFGSSRPGGYGSQDICLTTRKTLFDHFGPTMNLGPTVNSSSQDITPFISADGSTLYFCSNRSGGYGGSDLWQVSIEPFVDFNGDGTVDSGDMCIMVDHWGENYSLCDIGPMPWGDGVVDVQDLIVLAEHLFEEVFPVELIAYWKLDETEGDIANDSVGDNHGILSGNPTWQSDSGQVAGALELDGLDDYIETQPVLDPADGPFSVFAWIQGGAPGQVIISQTNGNGAGETWLGIDALGGNLMTGLVPPAGRSPSLPLVSESMITDSNWHHIGFVWDGANRILYVDDVQVVEDTQDGLEGSNNGLYIGTGQIIQTGTYFSGLIDDIRLYNRAVRP